MTKKKKNTWTPYNGNTTYIDRTGKEVVPMVVSSDGKRAWTLDDLHRHLVDAVHEDGHMDVYEELETLSDQSPEDALVSLVQAACDAAGALGEFIAQRVTAEPSVITLRRREVASASAD